MAAAHPLPPQDFAAFDEPGFVKIAWTLRADPTGAGGSIFRTETRAIATNAEARRKFRRYWSFLSPGIILIRRASLKPLKAAAERRAAEGNPTENPFVAGARPNAPYASSAGLARSPRLSSERLT